MSDRVELADDAKTAIVQALACFDTPSDVVRLVKEDFGLVVSRQAVEAYDPTKRAGVALSAELRAIFEATRAKFLADTATIGVSHRAVRLRRLQRIADKAEGMGNLPLAAEILQQVAKEMGDAFTNRRELTGKDGTPLPASPVTIFQLPDNGRG